MRKIYIDADFKCHLTNDGSMQEVEVDFFDGKCDEFVEGFRYVPPGEKWIREDGFAFSSGMFSPCQEFSVLEKAQDQYERNLMEQSLQIMGVII